MTEVAGRVGSVGPGEGNDERALLEARARLLARPFVDAKQTRTFELLVFQLGEERYALETTYVFEVLRLEKLTAVPGTPSFVAGLTSVRGEILAVLDLRSLFGLATPARTPSSRVVVLGEGRRDFGLLADAAHDVVQVPEDAILPGATGEGADVRHVRGVTRDGLVMLEGARLLGDLRLYVDQADDEAER